MIPKPQSNEEREQPTEREFERAFEDPSGQGSISYDNYRGRDIPESPLERGIPDE